LQLASAFGDSQGVFAAGAFEEFVGLAAFQLGEESADFRPYRPPELYKPVIFRATPFYVA
jgi:hypothetical protein